MADQKKDPMDMSYCIDCGRYALDNFKCADCKEHDAEVESKMVHPALVPIIVKNENREGKLKFFRREDW